MMQLSDDVSIAATFKIIQLCPVILAFCLMPISPTYIHSHGGSRQRNMVWGSRERTKSAGVLCVRQVSFSVNLNVST